MTEVHMDGDISSPECLMTSEPVKDPYSTDEEQNKRKKLRRSSPQENTVYGESQGCDFPDSLALYRTNCGSKFKGEQSYFYHNIHFPKIEGQEEIRLEDKSLDECLFHLFKFASTKYFNEDNSTWNGVGIRAIREHELALPAFTWLTENDNIDWKTAISEKKFEISQLHGLLMTDQTLLKSTNDAVLDVVVKIKALYHQLQGSQFETRSLEDTDRCKRHQTIRSCIESMAMFACQSGYLRSGQCEQSLDFYVPDDVVSDNSPLIPEGREVLIRNTPDGVFTFPYAESNVEDWIPLWLVPVQIYVPSSEKTEDDRHLSPPKSAFVPVKPLATNSADGNAENSSTRDSLPPETSLDSLLNPDYVEQTRKYIAAALPVHCRIPDCMDKLAGQHVQQLLAVAKQITVVQSSFLDRGVLEMLGLFVMNEYVYFSRLDIEKRLIYYLKGDIFKGVNRNSSDGMEKFLQLKMKAYRELSRPSMSYSNFRLDLTLSKHSFVQCVKIYVPSSEKTEDDKHLSQPAKCPKSAFVPVKPLAENPNDSPKCNVSPPHIQVQVTCVPADSADGNAENSSSRHSLPPETSLDSLLNPDYIEQTRKYIAAALPVHCRIPDCVDKLAGQHVQQLLAVSKQITVVQSSFLDRGVLEILGLFVLNEYVYFSRLDIEKRLVYYLKGDIFKAVNRSDGMEKFLQLKMKAYRELSRPSMSYSNFRLDLTLSKHRLALMIFIRQYILAFSNTRV